MSLQCTMILGDCLEVMPRMPKSSVQMCFADLPYAIKKRGCSEHLWDTPFLLPSLWSAVGQVVSRSWRAVYTATQPFASCVVQSNMTRFSHDVIWIKTHHSSPLTAKIMPLRIHESILIFGTPGATYNPQMTKGKAYSHTYSGNGKSGHYRGERRKAKGDSADFLRKQTVIYGDDRYPLSHVTIASEGRSGRLHPTQKPVSLLNWLIRTYSNPGDNVIDPVSGSGTTACAGLACGRNVTCIEKDEGYFDASVERVQKTIRDGNLDVALEVRR